MAPQSVERLKRQQEVLKGSGADADLSKTERLQISQESRKKGVPFSQVQRERALEEARRKLKNKRQEKAKEVESRIKDIGTPVAAEKLLSQTSEGIKQFVDLTPEKIAKQRKSKFEKELQEINKEIKEEREDEQRAGDRGFEDQEERIEAEIDGLQAKKRELKKLKSDRNVTFEKAEEFADDVGRAEEREEELEAQREQKLREAGLTEEQARNVTGARTDFGDLDLSQKQIQDLSKSDVVDVEEPQAVRGVDTENLSEAEERAIKTRIEAEQQERNISLAPEQRQDIAQNIVDRQQSIKLDERPDIEGPEQIKPSKVSSEVPEGSLQSSIPESKKPSELKGVTTETLDKEERDKIQQKIKSEQRAEGKTLSPSRRKEIAEQVRKDTPIKDIANFSAKFTPFATAKGAKGLAKDTVNFAEDVQQFKRNKLDTGLSDVFGSKVDAGISEAIRPDTESKVDLFISGAQTAKKGGLQAGKAGLEAGQDIFGTADQLLTSTGRTLRDKEERRIAEASGLQEDFELTGAKTKTRTDFGTGKEFNLEGEIQTQTAQRGTDAKSRFTKSAGIENFGAVAGALTTPTEERSIKQKQRLEQAGVNIGAVQRGEVLKEELGREGIKEESGLGLNTGVTFGGALGASRDIVAKEVDQETEKFIEDKFSTAKGELESKRDELSRKVEAGELIPSKAQERLDNFADKKTKNIEKQAKEFKKKVSDKKLSAVEGQAIRSKIGRAVADIPLNVATGFVVGSAAGASRTSKFALEAVDVAETALFAPQIAKDVSRGNVGNLGGTLLRAGAFGAGGAAGSRAGARATGRDTPSQTARRDIDRSTVVQREIGEGIEGIKEIKIPQNLRSTVDDAKARGFEVRVIEGRIQPPRDVDPATIPDTRAFFVDIINRAGQRVERIDVGKVNVKQSRRSFSKDVVLQSKLRLDKDFGAFTTRTLEGKLKTGKGVQNLGVPSFKVEEEFLGTGSVQQLGQVQGQGKQISGFKSKFQEVPSRSVGLGISGKTSRLDDLIKTNPVTEKPDFNLDSLSVVSSDISKAAKAQDTPVDVTLGAGAKARKQTFELEDIEGKGRVTGELQETAGFGLTQRQLTPRQQLIQEGIGGTDKTITGDTAPGTVTGKTETGAGVKPDAGQKADLTSLNKQLSGSLGEGLTKQLGLTKQPKTTKKTTKPEKAKQPEGVQAQTKTTPQIQDSLFSGQGQPQRANVLRRAAKEGQDLDFLQRGRQLDRQVGVETGLTQLGGQQFDAKQSQFDLQKGLQLGQTSATLFDQQKQQQRDQQLFFQTNFQTTRQTTTQTNVQRNLQRSLQTNIQTNLQAGRDFSFGRGLKLRTGKKFSVPINLKEPDKKQKKAKEVDSYNVLVKSQGEFKEINKKPLPKNKALNFGAFVTDHSLSAQFKVEETGKKKKKSQKKQRGIPNAYFFFNQDKFRDFKVKGGKKKPLEENKYIEKRNRRLDTGPEANDITATRLAKRVRKKAKKSKKTSKGLDSLSGTGGLRI